MTLHAFNWRVYHYCFGYLLVDVLFCCFVIVIHMLTQIVPGPCQGGSLEKMKWV